MASTSRTWKLTVVNYSSMSATTFLLWDALITLGDEVSLIWTKPNSFRAKWLFLFVRYFAIAFHISLLAAGTAEHFHYTSRACMIWYIYQEIAAQVLTAIVEVVLILRVRALYIYNIAVTRILFALFFLENACMVGASILSARTTVFDTTTCLAIHTPLSLIFFIVAFGVFETILFALTLLKSVRTPCPDRRDMPILTALVRDGTWAFALVFAALMINGGYILGASDGMAAVAYRWLFSIESFAGTRLILNMLALESPSDDSDNIWSTGMQFTGIDLRQRREQSEFDSLGGQESTSM